MVEADRQQRQLLIQQALNGADDVLFSWAGHLFFVEAKNRFIQMPWDIEHPASVFVGKKITETVIASPVEEAPVPKTKKKPTFDPVTGNYQGWASAQDVSLNKSSLLDAIFGKSLDKAVAKNPKSKVVPFEKTFEDTLDHLNKLLGCKFKQWTPIVEAPIIKKKAYNPVSLHIPKGGIILFKKSFFTPNPLVDKKQLEPHYVGHVIGFTKFYVKVKKYSAIGQITTSVAYNNIVSLATL